MSKLEEREAKRRSVIAGFTAGKDKHGRAAGKQQERECKKRFCLALKPSLYKEIQQLAYIQRRSASQIIDELMERYLRENAKTIEEFRESGK